MPDKLKKLENLINLVQEGLTREEFLKSFKVVVKQLLKLEKDLTKRNSEDIQKSKMFIEQLGAKLDSTTNQKLLDALSKIDKALTDQQNGMNFIHDKVGRIKDGIHGNDGSDGRDGKDADEKKIIKEVLSKIPKVELPDRVEIEEKVKELEEKLRGELRKEISSIPRGGGSRKIVYQRHYDLSALCDGATKTFTMPKDTLKIIAVAGTQFPINFRKDVDWSFDGRTLTLLDPVPAPDSGQTLYAILETQFYA